MKHPIKTLSLSFFLVLGCHATSRIGYVIDPIADLIGSPIKSQPIIKNYNQIPLCGAKPTIASCCPRLHQALFNEQVTIIDENTSEYYVELPTVYYLVNKKRQCRYWIEKRAVKTTESLKKEGLDPHAFPRPSFSSDRYKKADTVILIAPWHDELTAKTYSVGTRFVLTKKMLDTKYASVKLYNPQQKKVVISHIPKDLVLLDIKKPDSGKRSQFVTLVRTLTENSDGYIPYVWGGMSYTGRSKAGYITEVPVLDGKYSYFTLFDQKQSPKQGFDCSGLIARAAEIVGIPYTCKNSITANLTLKHLTQNDVVQPGDIIWFPGHVIIISDPEKSLVIEARGYGVGFGKIHELPIDKIFKNVATIADLQKMLGNPKKQITRIDREGNTKETHYDFAILSLTDAT